MNSMLRFLLVLTLLAFQSACIVLPVGIPGKNPFKDKNLPFIEIGKSTKYEIDDAMLDLTKGKGSLTQFRGGDWWLYAQTRKEAKWLVALVSPAGADGLITGNVDHRLLLIKFDNNGVVSGYEQLSSEGGGCNRHGVCVRESRHMLLAAEDEDRVAKQFDIPANRCGVYLYSEKISEAYFPSEDPVQLDGHQVGWFLDKKQFFSWQLAQGVHELYISDHRPIEFDCIGGDLNFFEVRREIRPRDPATGRKAIAQRQLTLNTS